MLWSAARGWLQLAIGLAVFALVTQYLTAAEIGAYGAVTLLLGLAEATLCAPLSESLAQRRTIEPDHLHATFWAGLAVAALGAVALAGSGSWIASSFAAPMAGALVPWAAMVLPAAALGTVPSAVLARSLRFDTLAQASMVSAVVSGLLTVPLLLAGAGVWALLAPDLVARALRSARVWRAARYRVAWPGRLGAALDLVRFNLATVATYWLGHADRAAPRLIAGVLLGPAALGYLTVAQRVLDMLGQLVLNPVASVAMASVARLQDDRAALQDLVRRLYRAAALLGYPAFLGAMVLTPDLARLAGPEWAAAVVATQLLLLVGLRTATGLFNLPVLRGLGWTGWPLVLLALGLALHAVLVPLGAAWGVEGVAAAMLVRVLATWPLGVWLIGRATGLRASAQLAAGWPSLCAALGMAVAVWAALAIMPGGPLGRLALGAGLGVVAYGVLLLALSPGLARLMAGVLRRFARGDRAGGVQALKAGLGLQVAAG